MRFTSGIFCLALILIVPLGCGHRSQLARKVISGTVTCGGEAVPSGFIRFAPIEGTSGPNTTARIVDGRYRADNRGGVPLGKHRVEIDAQRPTGEKIEISPGDFVEKMEDIGDRQYAGSQSPLTAEVSASGPDTMDFEIP
ncbi:MAG: hypothetical protein GX594_19155 [Pirellulaceae bacterium]|nr:hypothetical protein [Pirellulaceae bacterium]